MFHRCLFCHRPFPENGRLEHSPRGLRFAFDPARGRVWTVCDACRRWTLQPLVERLPALDELERVSRDLGRPLAHTAHVQLFQAGRLSLVRVGRADLAEQAWWRYGRTLRERKRAFESTRSRVAAYTFGALTYIGDAVGYSDVDAPIDWKEAPVADVLRWRRFGWAAWYGRETCAHCRSTLVALRYDLSWWSYPLRDADGRLGLGVPCQRCDPWTPEKVFRLRGVAAETALRRVLVYQNVTGADERTIADAARAISDAGSAGSFVARSAGARECLWKLGPTRTLALEIAVNEDVERRLLDHEARELAFTWRREEELAAIVDEELEEGSTYSFRSSMPSSSHIHSASWPSGRSAGRSPASRAASADQAASRPRTT